MKIGIDVSQIVYGTGVSNYTKNLAKSLLKTDKKNEYILFGGGLRRMADLKNFSSMLTGKFKEKFYPLSPLMLDFIWNRLHLFPIENFTGEIDVFHSSDWAQPPAREAKLVTTIHDLVPLLYPQSVDPQVVSVHQRRLEWVKKEVDRVIAVSNTTKNDIINRLEIPEQKISVIYEAPDPLFKPINRGVVQKTRERFNIPDNYFLAVGADPRKNINRIAQALEKIPNHPSLLVVGRKWQDIESHNIIWLGYVSNEVLVSLYTSAQALVYASLYEGFGLPILEAMACGCPVVTSNVASMPEIAGDAAVLVDPTQTDDIVRGIGQALTKRDQLVKKGLLRVKQFSWEKCAKQTLAVYEEVAR